MSVLMLSETPKFKELKPQIRKDGSLAFGDIKIRGISDQRPYALLSETIARLPDDLKFVSLDRIVFSERKVKRVLGITHLQQVAETEEELLFIHVITMYSSSVKKTPSRALVAGFAHELGHVWLDENKGIDDSEKREEAVHKLIRKWGFEAEAALLECVRETCNDCLANHKS